jgi:hypothetical protein
MKIAPTTIKSKIGNLKSKIPRNPRNQGGIKRSKAESSEIKGGTPSPSKTSLAPLLPQLQRI